MEQNSALGSLEQGQSRSRAGFIGAVLYPGILLALIRFCIAALGQNETVYGDDYSIYLVFQASRALFPVLLVVLLLGRPLSRRVKCVTLILATAMSSAGAVMILFSMSDGISGLVLVGVSVAHMGLGWLYVSVGELYCRVRITDVALSIALSLVLSASMNILLLVLSYPMRVMCIVGASLVACWMLLTYDRREYPVADARAKIVGYYDYNSVFSLGKWMLALIVFSITQGAVRVWFATGADTYSSDTLFVVSTIVTVVISLLVALLFFFANRPLSIDAFWFFVIPAMCITMVISLVFSDLLQISLSVFAGIRYVVVGILNIKFIDIAHHSRVPMYVVLSIGWGAVLFNMMFGLLLALYVTEIMGVVAPTVAVVLLTALAMIPLLLSRSTSLSDVYVGGAISDDVLGNSSSEQEAHEVLMFKCRDLKDRFTLSERELEIIFLISQGHTQPYCAEALYLSVNTVRGYMKSIYRKMNIHSKDELIRILNEPRGKC